MTHIERITNAIHRFNSLTHYPIKLDDQINSFREFQAELEKKVKEHNPNAPFPTSESAKFVEAWINLLEARTREREMAPPWTVTGRANYKGNPDKARRIYEKALENYKAKEYTFEKSVKKLVVPEFDSEIERVEAKIQKLEKFHATMKAINSIVRKHKKNLEEAVPLIIEAGLSEKNAREIIKPDCFGGIGFASFSLTNNNADIKRNKERLARLKLEDSKETKEVETEVEGVKIVDSLEENRIQVFYPNKPDEATRTLLKKNGFNWSPRNGAWQRQRTDNTRSVIKNLFGVNI